MPFAFKVGDVVICLTEEYRIYNIIKIGLYTVTSVDGDNFIGIKCNYPDRQDISLGLYANWAASCFALVGRKRPMPKNYKGKL